MKNNKYFSLGYTEKEIDSWSESEKLLIDNAINKTFQKVVKSFDEKFQDIQEKTNDLQQEFTEVLKIEKNPQELNPQNILTYAKENLKEINQSISSVLKDFKEGITNFFKKDKEKPNYEKGSFGHYWTEVLGREDVKGKKYDGNLDISGLGLTSLDGCPKEIKGMFNCSNNNLTSLEHSPNKVLKRFDCSNNNLENLKGVENLKFGKHPVKDFNCGFNKLKNLDELDFKPNLIDIAKSFTDTFHNRVHIYSKGNNFNGLNKEFHFKGYQVYNSMSLSKEQTEVLKSMDINTQQDYIKNMEELGGIRSDAYRDLLEKSNTPINFKDAVAELKEFLKENTKINQSQDYK